MEKIWIKKELYFEKYEFLKFSPFSDFYLNFKVIFRLISLLKSRKRGVFLSTGPRLMTWQAYLTWQAGPRRPADVARR